MTWGQAVAASRTAPARSVQAQAKAKLDPVVRRTATSADETVPMVITPPVVPPPPQEYALDLTTALRLAEVENPEIGAARQRILEAAAVQQQAYALMLPSFNAGTNYHGHTGNLQRSSGRILNLSEQSLYFGGGARTLAAETLSFPAVNISSPLADAIFEPLAARQILAGARFDAAATANTVLLDVATLYFELLAADVNLGLRRETESEATVAAQLTASYAAAGQGYPADANRAATLLKLIHREVERAEEEVAVASARLSRRLHLDPVVRLRPMTPGIAPIALIDPDSATADLIRVALQQRPEMGSRAAAIGTAEARLNAEIARPLLPTVWLGFSGGGFGGGSNLVPPFLGNFGGRTDFDVRAFWTLQGMGLGNLAYQKRARAVIGETVGEQSRMINRIRREVAGSHGRLLAARGRLASTQHQLDTAKDGFREDLIRLKNPVGPLSKEDRPIELTNSLELLQQARVDHLAAILDYNRAQLKLFVSLGTPPPLERPATEPLPPAPVAPPPLPLPQVR
jgi:outer membrane protein TolC